MEPWMWKKEMAKLQEMGRQIHDLKKHRTSADRGGRSAKGIDQAIRRLRREVNYLHRVMGHEQWRPVKYSVALESVRASIPTLIDNSSTLYSLMNRPLIVSAGPIRIPMQITRFY